MTHAAQEVCLSLVGAVRFRRGLLEIFLVFELFRLLLVDVAGGNEKMRYISTVSNASTACIALSRAPKRPKWSRHLKR